MSQVIKAVSLPSGANNLMGKKLAFKQVTVTH